jgi:hypothetical protein
LEETPPAESIGTQARAAKSDTRTAQPSEATLRGLDAHLAGNVDDLLESDFESVASVLEGAFDDHASGAVDAEDGDPESNEMLASLLEGAVFESYAEIVGEPTSPADSTQAGAEQDLGDADADASNVSADAEADATSVAVEADESGDARPSAPAQAEAVVEASADSPEAAAEATEPDGSSTPGDVETDAVEAEPQIVASDAAVGDGSLGAGSAPAEPAATQPQATATTAERPSEPDGAKAQREPAASQDAAEDDDESSATEPRTGKLLGVVVSVLSGMNLPIRVLPLRFRPVVDWLALSLILWVPIVWLFAVFLGGD